MRGSEVAQKIEALVFQSYATRNDQFSEAVEVWREAWFAHHSN